MMIERIEDSTHRNGSNGLPLKGDRRLPVLSEPKRFSDSEGRQIGYLRLSLTRACAMRCLYCRPEKLEDDGQRPRMSPDEIEAMVRHLVSAHGLHKVRLTGGDPTSRRDLIQIVQKLSSIQGLDELVMTTHGLTLERDADRLAEAGLQRVNISLDSLDEKTFERMTGVDGLPRVLRGIAAAKKAGLSPVRLNTVVVRGQNEAQVALLLRFAADQGVELRFIELMPMGPLADRWQQRYVPEPDIWKRLDPIVLEKTVVPIGADSARRYRLTLDDGKQVLMGLITPMSCPFCSACNRIRIAADGTFYPCLMDRPVGSLMSAIRPNFDPTEFDRLIRAGMGGKAPEHPPTGYGVMTHIGG